MATWRHCSVLLCLLYYCSRKNEACSVQVTDVESSDTDTDAATGIEDKMARLGFMQSPTTLLGCLYGPACLQIEVS